jgi:hypothetical protein
MDKEELMAALAAVLQVVSRQVEDGFKLTEDEELVVKSAVRLLIKNAQECENCVDY